ncbi:MAG: hypothetical protein H0V64_02205 [Geodermatophilaceae bacterium]|jgi:hypothetical protein|nr:hypothetical protein [Geodermatophilaceae bacterium]MDQ3464931.1 DUF6458 family protein [Actinomycetota bacterium]
MGVGISIFLLALGAILAFAVTGEVSGIDLDIVGFVLMAVGVVGIIISLVLMNQRSNTSHRVVEERRYRDDGTLY